MIESYRDLVAWQKAMVLVQDVYGATFQLPQSEKFGLISQLRRAAVSIPSALAEGHARASTREFSHYVSIARGSLAEVETQLLISQNLGFLSADRVDVLMSLCDEQSRVLRGLKKSLDNRVANARHQRTLTPNPSPLIP
jgi:four helix bundle protein